MIFRISNALLDSAAPNDVCEYIDHALRRGHLLAAARDERVRIRSIMESQGGVNAVERFRKCRPFEVSVEQERYLATVECPDWKVFEKLSTEPAKLLIENGFHEWPIYCCMIDAYSSDPEFGNMFSQLRVAKEKGWLRYLHLGGCGDMIAAHASESFNEGGTDWNTYKRVTLLDRDSAGPGLFSTTNTSVRNNVRHLCGKELENVGDADIYSLDQHPHIWHIWYRRRIENYIPDSRLPEKYRIENPDGMDHWREIKVPKRDIADYFKGLKRKDFEEGQQHFDINGITVSELQLLLLKLVRII